MVQLIRPIGIFLLYRVKFIGVGKEFVTKRPKHAQERLAKAMPSTLMRPNTIFRKFSIAYSLAYSLYLCLLLVEDGMETSTAINSAAVYTTRHGAH